MKYREIRERAAELLERDGWRVNGHVAWPRRTLLRAIRDAADNSRIAAMIQCDIGDELGGPDHAWDIVPKFDAAPGRTLAEVLAALRGVKP